MAATTTLCKPEAQGIALMHAQCDDEGGNSRAVYEQWSGPRLSPKQAWWVVATFSNRDVRV